MSEDDDVRSEWVWDRPARRDALAGPSAGSLASQLFVLYEFCETAVRTRIGMIRRIRRD